jgi:tryptophan halogenase
MQSSHAPSFLHKQEPSKSAVKNVVIAGGGTAGWMAAAAFSKLLGKSVNITLVESDLIGTVGVGEATIPTIRSFHRLLGISESEFIKQTDATFKLGIQFENWKKPNSSYFHSFGVTGQECWAGEFHHFWLRGKNEGMAENFGDYCPELVAAKQNKFATSQQNPMNFAYHLDATKYAQFLRQFAEKLGVKRIEGKIESVIQDPQSGFVKTLMLNNKQEINGDLFIDCTGFIALLIEKTLGSKYEDWSQWLLTDTAYAVQTESVRAPVPYTRSIAHSAGWQWQIPLQTRTGNGYVFSSQFQSDENALATLLGNISGNTINEPRKITFTPGIRPKSWDKNVVAIGLSSGFIEPLESTSIHLITTGILRLMQTFPFNGVCESLVNEYNRQYMLEMQTVRDFIIMHYKVNQHTNSAFWEHYQNLEIPDSLQHKLALFSQSGRVFLDEADVFRVDSYTQVLMGQGIVPQQYHKIADEMSKQEFTRFMLALKQLVSNKVAKLPQHQAYIEHCIGRKLGDFGKAQ